MHKGSSRWLIAAVAVAASAVTAPASAGAQESQVLRACVKKSGAMRVLLKGKKCRKREKRLSWNVTGPAGAPGTHGAAGTPGAKGDPGPAGPIEGTPAGGALAGTYPNPMLASGSVGAAAIAAALLDGEPAMPTLRSLGDGAGQAAAGNDPRLSDARVPTGPAGGDLSGSFPAPAIAANAIGAPEVAPDSLTAADLSPALDDGAAAAATLRSLGTGAQQAAAGNDPRLSDQRVPTDGSVTGAKVSNGSLRLGDVFTGSGTFPSTDLPTIAAHSCQGFLTSVGGAGPGSIAFWYAPGLDLRLFLPSTIYQGNSMPLRVCNLSPNAIDPPALTFTAHVLNP